MGLMRWLRTIRHLRPVQIYGRLWFRLARPSLDTSPAPPRRSPIHGWVIPAARAPSMRGPRVLEFLNEQHEILEKNDWDNPKYGKLWRYNLHYFDDLNSKEASSRAAWHRGLLSRWVVDNPPGLGSGWEPYPTSLRIVNWIKWCLAGNELPEKCIESLAVQARWLNKRLEYHLLGNHLFSNAKALVFAGLFFEGEEADRWCEQGFSILAREIPEQILGDGGQFERSTMYHALALEDMLDLLNVTSTHSEVLPEQWRTMVLSRWPNIVTDMRRWLAAMCHPDGDIAFFNDAAFGIAPPPAELEQYARRLGRGAIGTVSDHVFQLAQSGYFRVEKEDMVALLDVAPTGPDYLPGHAHADTLSFELSLFDNRIIVNSGTSCYERGLERGRQRGTAAHNTVIVNGENSSEVWAGFRVGRRAYPSIDGISKKEEALIISASHDGYCWLPGHNRHRRRWCFEQDALLIEDEITGDFREAVAHFHLHPDVATEQGADEHQVILMLPGGKKAKFVVEGGALRLQAGMWHPQFGVSVPNICLAVDFREAVVTTTIHWE